MGINLTSWVGANLRTITAPPRFVISSGSSHHSDANIVEAKVGSFARPSLPLMTMATTVTSTADPTTTTKERLVDPSIFGGGSSSGAEHIVGGLSGLTGSDFIVGGIRTVVSPDTDLQKVYIPQWSVTNGAASQMSLSAEVRMRAEFNIREKRRLCSLVEEKDSLLKVRDEEIKSLKAQLLVKETEAAKAIHLRAEASKFEVVEKSLQDEKNLKRAHTALEKRRNDRLADQVHELETSSAGLQEKVTVYENCMSQLEKFQDEQMAVVHEKFNKLDVDFCLNSLEYLYALGEAINKAIKKGMQDGLAAGITHGQEGRVLTDVAAFNPSTEYIHIPLLVKSLDEALAKRLGLNDSQPHVDQLMVPVHHSLDQTVIGAIALSLSLDVSHGRVQRIRENIANNRSVLRDVFVSFSKPLSVAALEGTGVLLVLPLITTTALS
ncbi:hypothetical protein Tco_0845251 [Tanacetum coccineum]